MTILLQTILGFILKLITSFFAAKAETKISQLEEEKKQYLEREKQREEDIKEINLEKDRIRKLSSPDLIKEIAITELRKKGLSDLEIEEKLKELLEPSQ